MLPARRDLMALQEAMLELEQVELKPEHHYAGTTYGRELFIPAGVALVGKIHKLPCINIIAEGKVRVVSEQGSFTYEAPYVFVSPAGTKRAMYAITDTTWVTCHPYDDTKDLEEQLIVPSFDLLEDK